MCKFALSARQGAISLAVKDLNTHDMVGEIPSRYFSPASVHIDRSANIPGTE